MRTTPLKSLPDNYQEIITVGRYTFFVNDNGRIIWKRKDSDLYILSLEMTNVPKEERFMFWYDKNYREEVLFNS